MRPAMTIILLGLAELLLILRYDLDLLHGMSILTQYDFRVLALYPRNKYILVFFVLLYGAEVAVMAFITVQTKGLNAINSQSMAN